MTKHAQAIAGSAAAPTANCRNCPPWGFMMSSQISARRMDGGANCATRRQVQLSSECSPADGMSAAAEQGTSARSPSAAPLSSYQSCVSAKGAMSVGAELRHTLGTAVFSGMIGFTVFGLIFTPAFYVVCRWLATRFEARRAAPAAAGAPAEQARSVGQVCSWSVPVQSGLEIVWAPDALVAGIFCGGVACR